jgi:hypothetical protein
MGRRSREKSSHVDAKSRNGGFLRTGQIHHNSIRRERQNHITAPGQIAACSPLLVGRRELLRREMTVHEQMKQPCASSAIVRFCRNLVCGAAPTLAFSDLVLLSRGAARPNLAHF